MSVRVHEELRSPSCETAGFDKPVLRLVEPALREAPRPSDKDVPLEAIRGVAALSVVVWHSLLAFYPELTGQFSRFDASQSLAREPWFGLIHGSAAITLFFVLSAFVLTRKYFVRLDNRLLLRGAVKRWPRLAGPVFAAVMASFGLFALGAYRYEVAAQLTQSPWLKTFGNAPPFQPGLVDALRQGLFSVFFVGDSYYDSSLWTMKFEFYGSLLAFAVAAGIGALRSATFAFASLIGFCIVLGWWAEAYLPFVVGAGLAWALPRRDGARRLPLASAAAAIGLAVYGFGYSGRSFGAFGWFPEALDEHAGYVHVLASVALISAVELGGPALRARFSGRFCEFLGRLSFPVYLVHVLVLCSLGCAALLSLRAAGLDAEAARAAAMAVTIGASVVAALPLMAFNDRWTSLVNAGAARMLGRN
jgi:peptidoglycan/LPS O-acetylase OafA/YrhL